MSKSKGTFIEVNLSSLKHNFDYIKSLISKKTKVLAVVKAYAYGSNPVKTGDDIEINLPSL